MSQTIKFDPTVNSVQSQIITDVTPFADGLMTPAMLADLNQTLAFGNVDIYVDAVNGNDANPGTLAAPLQTWDAAVALLPSAWMQACRVHLAAGNYNFDDTVYTFGRMLGKQASPLTIIGAETDQLGTLTTIGGSTATSYVAAVATTTGALRGAALRNLRTGQQARISNNVFAAGNTTFTLENGTSLSVMVGDQFVVTKPGSNLLVPQFGVGGFINSFVGFQNIRFAAVAESGFEFPLLVFNVFAEINFFNCEIDGGTSNRDFLVGVNCQLGAGKQATGWSNDPTSTVGATQSGLWYHNAGTTPGGVCGAFYNGRMIGHLMLDNCFLYAQGMSGLQLGLDTTGSSVDVYEMSELELDSALMVGSHPFQADTILVQENSFATLANPADGGSVVTVNNSAGNALNFQNARGHVFDVAGTGNAGVGILSYMSQVLIDNSPGPSVTGTGGNTEVGTTVKAYGALPFTDAPTLSTIQVA